MKTNVSFAILCSVGIFLWTISHWPAGAPEISDQMPVTVLSAEEHLLWGMKIRAQRLGMEEWEMFPGIGPAMAKKIMTWQKTNGPIENIEELDQIPGIGPKTIQNLQPHLSFF